VAEIACSIGPVRVGDREPLLLIAGPCVAESQDLVLRLAERIAAVCGSQGFSFVFKASYDKANRSSLDSFRGPGLAEGLRILRRVKDEIGVAVCTDVHETFQVKAVGEVVDLIQIPAFLCRQTDLLLEAGRTGKPVNIKKGQFMSPAEMVPAVAKVRSTGNENVLVTERGTFFGYNALVNDFRSLSLMRDTGCPVVYDATHSVQRPGALGGASGGESRFVPALARAAVAFGVDGLFVEVHTDPPAALSDGPNMVALSALETMLQELRRVRKAVEGYER